MGRGSPRDFAPRERAAAVSFARMARDEGIERVGLVTPVDPGVARPLIEGLATPTVVGDPAGMKLFDVAPVGFEEALRRAVAGDLEMVPA
jgi:hypothetical protein